MSAHDQMRKMLDELMGTGRDGEVRKDHMPFTDGRVCRAFLVGCCPHEVLANTRMDTGECPKHHDPALRADFEKASKERDYYYDIDALEQLQRFFEDCDRKIELAKKRLAETQEELTTDVAEKANAVLELNEQIGKNLADAERLGEEGRVDESLKLMEKVEELRKTKQESELDYRNSMPASSYQQQKLRVCEVCCAFLGIHDNDRRLADHFGGKLHMGFVFLREKLAELQAKAPERRNMRDRNRGGSGSRAYSGRRYSDRGRPDDYQRNRDDRDRRRRSRSRSRDRNRANTNNKSRSPRDRRSRSRSGSRSQRHHRDRNDKRHKSHTQSPKRDDRSTGGVDNAANA